MVIFLSFISPEWGVPSKTAACTSLCPVIWAAAHVLLLGPARVWGSSAAEPLFVPPVLPAGPACPGPGGLCCLCVHSCKLWSPKGIAPLWKHPMSCGGNAWWGFQRSGWALLQGLPVFFFLLVGFTGVLCPLFLEARSKENDHIWIDVVAIVNSGRMARTCILLEFSLSMSPYQMCNSMDTSAENSNFLKTKRNYLLSTFEIVN